MQHLQDRLLGKILYTQLSYYTKPKRCLVQSLPGYADLQGMKEAAEMEDIYYSLNVLCVYLYS